MGLTEQQKRDIEFAGDPKEIVRKLNEFHESVTAFEEQREALLAKYPKQWVAFYGGELSAHAKTLDALLTKVDRSGIPRGETFVEFLDPNPLPRVLTPFA